MGADQHDFLRLFAAFDLGNDVTRLIRAAHFVLQGKPEAGIASHISRRRETCEAVEVFAADNGGGDGRGRSVEGDRVTVKETARSGGLKQERGDASLLRVLEQWCVAKVFGEEVVEGVHFAAVDQGDGTARVSAEFREVRFLAFARV